MKKTLIMLMAICMILPMTLLACKKTPAPGPSDGTTNGGNTQTNKPVVEDTQIPDTVGDATFEGSVFNIACRNGYDEEFIAEKSNEGDPINDIIYTRNLRTEVRLGVELKFATFPQTQNNTAMNDAMRTSITSNTDEFQLIANYAYYATPLVVQGMYYNYMDMEYIDTSKPWWNQSFVEQITANDNLYQLIGDITMTATDRTVCMFTNFDLATDYGIEDNLYSVVSEGKWTFEYLENIIANVYEDDGNNDKDFNDTYGLLLGSGGPPVEQLIYATGFSITVPGEDGDPVVAMNTAENIERFNMIYNLYYETDGVGFFKEYLYLNEAVGYFKANQGIFINAPIYYAKQHMTDVNFDYGILPLPKYDEQQKDYYSFVGDSYSQLSVPYNVGNPAMVGATLEVMAKLSYYDVRPQVFEVLYKLRYFDNPLISDIFDGILDNRVFDMGAVYSNTLNNPISVLRTSIASGTNTYASDVGAAAENIEKRLDIVLAELKKKK